MFHGARASLLQGVYADKPLAVGGTCGQKGLTPSRRRDPSLGPTAPFLLHPPPQVEHGPEPAAAPRESAQSWEQPTASEIAYKPAAGAGEKGTKISGRQKVVWGTGGEGTGMAAEGKDREEQEARMMLQGMGRRHPAAERGMSGGTWEGLRMPQPGHAERVGGRLLLGGTCTALKQTQLMFLLPVILLRVCASLPPSLTPRPACRSHRGEQRPVLRQKEFSSSPEEPRGCQKTCALPRSASPGTGLSVHPFEDPRPPT